MASSGVIANFFATGYKLQIEWTVNSQNVAANTSNVTAAIYLVAQPYYNIISGIQKNVTLTINGTTYTGTSSVDIPSVSYQYWIKLKEVTVDIPHNADGTKTCAFSGSLAIQATLNGTYYGTVSTSGSGLFDTIPRATTPILSKYTAEYGETIGVTLPRASSAFTHRLRYMIDLQPGTLAENVATGYDFDIPTAWMNWHTQSATSWGWLYVDTYNGTTLIGTTQTRFNTIVPSNVLPNAGSLTPTRIDNSVPSAWGVYVQGKSQVKLDIADSTGAYGSTITAYAISGEGYSGSTASLTTGVLNTAGQQTFTGTVTDSRGRTGSTTTSITVEPYTAPRIAAASFVRCLSDGTPDEDGTYIRALVDYEISTVDGNNTATRKIEWKRSASTTWEDAGSFNDNTPAVIGGGNIHVDYAHDVRVSVTDAFSTATNLGVVPTAFATIDFRKGGKGIAFGKVSTQEGFDLAMPLIVQDPAQARTALHAQQAINEVISMELGNNRTGAGPAFIDFHTREQPASDYDSRLIAWGSGDFNIETSGDIGLYPGSGRSVSINGNSINSLATKKVLMGTATSTGGMPNTAGSAWRWTDPQTVTFEEAFSSPPIVIANISDTSGVTASHVRGKTRTGFLWTGLEYGTADTGRNVKIDWIAIGE